MSFKAIAAASLVILVSSNLQAETAKQATHVISVKEIASASVDRNYRQLKLIANGQRYVMAFEEPCTALRRSDFTNDNQSSEQLGVGDELKIGKSSCMIKSIERDLDFATVDMDNHVEKARQDLISRNRYR